MPPTSDVITSRSGPRSVRLRPFVLRLHLILALVLGALLAVVCLSGSGAVLVEDIDRWLYADTTRLTPERAPFAIAMSNSVAAHPGTEVEWITTAAATGDVDVLWMTIPHGDGEGDDEVFQVYGDPGSGALVGTNRDGAVSTVMRFIADLHMTLLLGETGGWLLGFAGLALLTFVVSGLWLWWPGVRRLGTAFTLRWSKGGFLRHYDLHKLVGLVGIPLFILIGVTGVMFEFGWMRYLVHFGLGGSSEELRSYLKPEDQQPKALPQEKPRLSIDALAAAALIGHPDLRISGISTHTHAPTDPWWVQCTYDGSFDRTTGGVVMLLDPWTGERLGLEDGRTGSLGKWVGMHYWSLHTGWWGAPGSFLGWFGRVLYLIIGIGPTVLFITGLGIWLHRRKQVHVVAARRDGEATISKPASTIAEHSSVS